MVRKGNNEEGIVAWDALKGQKLGHNLKRLRLEELEVYRQCLAARKPEGNENGSTTKSGA